MRCPGFRQSHFLELSECRIRNSLNAGEIPGEHCERPHAAVQGGEGGLEVWPSYIVVAAVVQTTDHRLTCWYERCAWCSTTSNNTGPMLHP